MADIFLQIDSAEHGPYSEKQLGAWIAAGSISASVPAKREGSGKWRTLASLLDLPGPEPAAVPPALPLQERRTRGRASRRLLYARAEHYGYSRTEYVFNSLLVGIVFVGCLLVLVNAGEGGLTWESFVGRLLALPGTLWGMVWLAVLQTVLVGLTFWFGAQRLFNIGWSRLLVLLLLVPLANIVLQVALLALPPGYADTKKIDGAGWCWIVFFILQFLVLMGVVAVVGLPNILRAVRESAPLP